MKEFERKIKINDNRILIYNIADGYVPIHTIHEGFIGNGKVVKNYRLSRWDDYGFNGWIHNIADINSLSYDFDINHPLYIPLLHLLNGEDELIIDDDDTYELNKKYMIISKKEDKINLAFINDLEDVDIIDKFSVFIKNIGPDGRSKIDSFYKDTKERLYFFFKEVYERVSEEYHQITIEEYLLKNSKEFDNEEIKKYVRKMNIRKRY